MHSSRTSTAAVCLLLAISTLAVVEASPSREGTQPRADKWRWVVEDDDSEQATVAVFAVRERLDVVSPASPKTRIVYPVDLIADDFEEAARALDPAAERRGFALLDVTLTVEGQRYSISMMYGQGPDGKDVESWVIVQIEGPSRVVRRKITSAAEALYRQHPARIDCTPRAAPEESAAYRGCYPQSVEDALLAHAHRAQRPVSPPPAVHSAPPRPAETAPDLAAPKPSTLQAKPSSGATPDHRQSIIDFLGIVKSDEEFNAMQKKVAEGVAPTLDLLTAAGGARCAAVIEEKLSTPLFIRDEIARFMMSRTQPAHVGHAVSMLRYYKANPNPTEDDAAKQFLAVYPNESTALDAANRLWREVNGVKLAMELSILEAAQVRRNYCESTGGDDPQPTSLSVSCDTPEYRVTSVTPPVDGSNVWRVRYDRRGSTGTWEVTPSIRAKTLGTTTCRFIWE